MRWFTKKSLLPNQKLCYLNGSSRTDMVLYMKPQMWAETPVGAGTGSGKGWSGKFSAIFQLSVTISAHYSAINEFCISKLHDDFKSDIAERFLIEKSVEEMTQQGKEKEEKENWRKRGLGLFWYACENGTVRGHITRIYSTVGY